VPSETAGNYAYIIADAVFNVTGAVTMVDVVVWSND